MSVSPAIVSPDGLHPGLCDYDVGSGDGSRVVCTLCLAAIREHKRTACPDCGGAGWVVVAEVRPIRRGTDVRVIGKRRERCFSCFGTGQRTA